MIKFFPIVISILALVVSGYSVLLSRSGMEQNKDLLVATKVNEVRYLERELLRETSSEYWALRRALISAKSQPEDSKTKELDVSHFEKRIDDYLKKSKEPPLFESSDVEDFYALEPSKIEMVIGYYQLRINGVSESIAHANKFVVDVSGRLPHEQKKLKVNK